MESLKLNQLFNFGLIIMIVSSTKWELVTFTLHNSYYEAQNT